MSGQSMPLLARVLMSDEAYFSAYQMRPKTAQYELYMIPKQTHMRKSLQW